MEDMIKYILCTIFIFASIMSDSYGIVRHHKVDDKEYIKSAEKYMQLVRIETNNSFGSGVLVNPTTIITSAHNLKLKQNIKIIHNYQEIIPKTIIYHKNLDLAIIKIKSLQDLSLELYSGNYIDEAFVIVGFGYTGTGQTGARERDFKLRSGQVRCTQLKGDFCECLFDSESDLERPACAAKGDSGGAVFAGDSLAGIITYVSGQGGDGNADSTYGDKTAFIPIVRFEDWLIENL